MANYNKVILVGNLTRDPEMSYLPSGSAVTEIGLAVNRRWRSQDGQEREDTCFIDCRCYGKQAEVLSKYMSKGRPILVEGRLQLDQWEDQNGNKRSKHRVFIERFQFLGDGGGGGGQRGGGNYRSSQSGGPPQQQPQQSRPPQQQSGGGPPEPSDFDQGEDIPF